MALGKYDIFICTMKLQIMIDDGADTKQTHLIKISAIHVVSRRHSAKTHQSIF